MRCHIKYRLHHTWWKMCWCLSASDDKTNCLSISHRQTQTHTHTHTILSNHSYLHSGSPRPDDRLVRVCVGLSVSFGESFIRWRLIKLTHINLHTQPYFHHLWGLFNFWNLTLDPTMWSKKVSLQIRTKRLQIP